MAITAVPELDPAQPQILQPVQTSPYSPSWWVFHTITEIPTESVGWMVGQGWRITATTQDDSTNPPTFRYDMTQYSLENRYILQSLLDQWVGMYNLALEANAVRYNDIVENWTYLINTTQDYLETQVAEQNTYTTEYLEDLDSYMSDIESSSTQLETDYDAHAPVATGFLTSLGTTELARINEQFAATLATQTQQLIDQGLYTSTSLADITARNERDRDEQIQMLNDRLNREKFDNQHKLYEQEYRMQSAIISTRMGSYTARLDGLTKTHGQNIALMQYTMDQRNQITVGLYGFVERRDDVYPSFDSLVQLATGLGDSGGGWITP